MSHVFVSYSKKNKDYILKLVDKLLDEGFDVWIDNRRLRSSEDWWRSIVEALRDCGAFIVVLTPESDTSEWVQLEITLAMKYKKQRFPIWLSGSMDTANWAIFARTQFVDATNGQLPPPEFYKDLAAHARRKSFRGSAVTNTGRLDKKITQMMEEDPVLKEALDTPPQAEEEDGEDLDQFLARRKNRPISCIIISIAAALLLAGAALLVVPRIIAVPTRATATVYTIEPQTATIPLQPTSATPDLSHVPVTLENLNDWRVKNGYVALTENNKLDDIASEHLNHLITLSVPAREALENLNQWEGMTAQDMAVNRNYQGDVQMIVKISPFKMMMNELLDQIEMGGNGNAGTTHKHFHDIGLKMEQSAASDEWFLVLIVGSGSL